MNEYTDVILPFAIASLAMHWMGIQDLIAIIPAGIGLAIYGILHLLD